MKLFAGILVSVLALALARATEPMLPAGCYLDAKLAAVELGGHVVNFDAESGRHSVAVARRGGRLVVRDRELGDFTAAGEDEASIARAYASRLAEARRTKAVPELPLFTGIDATVEGVRILVRIRVNCAVVDGRIWWEDSPGVWMFYDPAVGTAQGHFNGPVTLCEAFTALTSAAKERKP